MDYAVALGVGVLAGLGVAIPLGAIGVLLLQAGLEVGPRGLAAAAAVATVDVGYCVLAVTLGRVVAPLISALLPWPAIVGGGILITLAVVGARRSRSTSNHIDYDPERSAKVSRLFFLFFGLTIVNPVTVLYFTALTVSLSDRVATLGEATSFVIGVAVASFAWQSALVIAGHLAGGLLSERARNTTILAGNMLVAVLGTSVIVGALLQIGSP